MIDEHEEGIEEDVQEECENFGKVIKVICAPGFDQKPRLFVEFSSHKG